MSNRYWKSSDARYGLVSRQALPLLASSAMMLLSGTPDAASAELYWRPEQVYDQSYGNPDNWMPVAGGRPSIPTIADDAYFNQYAQTGDPNGMGWQWEANRWSLHYGGQFSEEASDNGVTAKLGILF